MAISHNPTKTSRIEKAWLGDINRRWAEFKYKALGGLKSFSEGPDHFLLNEADPFVMSASQQRVYMAFLETEIQNLLLGTDQAPNWQAEYQLAAYERGLERTRQELIQQGAMMTPTTAEQLAASGITGFTATASLGSVHQMAPIHQEALEFLFNRSYKSLKKWTDAMDVEIRGILFSGVQEGQGIAEISRNITERIDVSKSRARTIARTETNQAYTRSAFAESQRASEEIGEEIKFRWLTALDERVRARHAAVHGVVMTAQRASRIKTNDGINCRCGLAPVLPEFDTPQKQAKFTQQRKELLAEESEKA